MNTCDTCKWWKPPEGKSENSICPRLGECSNDRFVKNLEDVKDDEMWAGESPSYACAPMTGPKFGCVHWESKQWKS